MYRIRPRNDTFRNGEEMILAIIGFTVLMLLGIWLLVVAGAVLMGSAFFGGNGVESVIPFVEAALVIWFACHIAPFTINFSGVVQ